MDTFVIYKEFLEIQNYNEYNFDSYLNFLFYFGLFPELKLGLRRGQYILVSRSNDLQEIRAIEECY